MLKHKNKIIAGTIAVIILIVISLCATNAFLPHKNKITKNPASDIIENEQELLTEDIESEINTQTEIKDTKTNEADNPANNQNNSHTNDNSSISTNKKPDITENISEKNTPKTDIAEQKIETPTPATPAETDISDKELTCTLSVRCDTILKNIERFNCEKIELIPQNGIIFPEQTVTFYEGESVFNLLVREMKKNKIHLEFENTPIYNSAYIEGINNIYEFECGELSGWMYKVNGVFPNYGSSLYQLNPGDKVEWVYTCDLGKDVGGQYSARNGK